MKKRILASICALIIALTCAVFTGCQTPDQSRAVVNVDVNPSIQFVVDAQNKVVSVNALNEDAQVLLYGEASFEGKDIEQAIETITSLAVEYGYLDEQNKVVQTSVSSDNEDLKNKLTTKVNASVTAGAQKLGFSVTVDDEVAYSLMRKYEDYKLEHLDDEQIQALTVEKFRLALNLSQSGKVSLDVAVKMDEKQLIDKISEVDKKVKNFATKAYEKAKALAQNAYDEAVGVLVDNVYNEYYLTHLLAHPTTFYYGSAYQSYKLASRGFGAVAKVMTIAENIYVCPLDSAVVENAAQSFGIADQLDQLKDNDGNYTLESICAYADKVIKNSEEGVELEQLKTQIDAQINTLVSEAKDEVAELLAQYEPQIREIISKVNDVVKSVESVMPATLKASFEESMSTFNEVVTEFEEAIESGTFNSAKVYEFQAKMVDKANKMLALIKADIGDEAFNECQNVISSRQQSLDQLKTTMENAIAQAEEQAKSFLSSLKESRKEN